jgi:hypothetical protein
MESVFSKGQSKRIWNELYKVCILFNVPFYIDMFSHELIFFVIQVIDSSDVILQVGYSSMNR